MKNSVVQTKKVFSLSEVLAESPEWQFAVNTEELKRSLTRPGDPRFRTLKIIIGLLEENGTRLTRIENQISELRGELNESRN